MAEVTLETRTRFLHYRVGRQSECEIAVNSSLGINAMKKR